MVPNQKTVRRYDPVVTEALDKLRAATRKYDRLTKEAKDAREDVVKKVVAALLAGEYPKDVVEASPFTDVYIRRIARSHGIAPARRGVKPSNPET